MDYYESEEFLIVYTFCVFDGKEIAKNARFAKRTRIRKFMFNIISRDFCAYSGMATILFVKLWFVIEKVTEYKIPVKAVDKYGNF